MGTEVTTQHFYRSCDPVIPNLPLTFVITITTQATAAVSYITDVHLSYSSTSNSLMNLFVHYSPQTDNISIQ